MTTMDSHNDSNQKVVSSESLPIKDEEIYLNESNEKSEVMLEEGAIPHHRTDGGPFPGDEDFDVNNAPVHFVIDEWAQGTSIHGVPFVTDQVTWRAWKRAMWVVLVCVSSGFMIWQFSALISQYRSYEVITDTETINPTALEFPEITICNMNTFSRELMAANGITNPKNEEELLKISSPIEDFIKQASFNGVFLTNLEEHFKSQIVEWGRCWSFVTNETVYRPGYYGGLHFYADLQQHDYDSLSQFAGVGVWTQMPGTLVTSSLPIFASQTGKETLVNLRKTEFQREKELPWARCKSKAPEYTQSRCKTECMNQKIVEECGCRRYSDKIASTSVRLCNRPFAVTEDAICAHKLMANESIVLHECDCSLPSCSQIEYEGHTTEVNPSQVFLDTTNFTAWDTNRTYMLENFVSVTVNFDKLQYDLLTESKAMSFADLLASIGGSMGFFLGISMLSIFELIGDLGLLRLVPRFCGRKNLHGLGAKAN